MAPQPNILFLFPDEWRSQAIGFRGMDPVITPNLDAFAAQSLVLTNATSVCPICSPYRAAMFSGKYPMSSGVVTNCYSGTIPRGIELKADERCLSDVLHDAGYSQGYIGKLHLDLPKEEDVPYTEGWRGEPGKGSFWDAYTPPGPRRHGFDFWHSYGCCDRHLTPHYWVNDAKVDERTDIEQWSVEHETDVAIDFLRNEGGKHRDADKPWSLFIAHNPPHMPFEQVPAKYVEQYGDATPDELLVRPNVRLEGRGASAPNCVKNYFAAVTGIDEQFGRILRTLDELGMTDNTIIVVTSDHGEMMGSHGLMGKDVWYDESFLIPFVVRWPGHITPGSDDLLLNAPDVMPSLLGLAGLSTHIPEAVEGSDYSKALLGQECTRPESAFYFLDQPQLNGHPRRRGIRTHTHTYVVSGIDSEPRTFLHDNREDPYQMRNIASEQPKVAKELEGVLRDWLDRTGDSFLKETQ